jgi:hypothetical protein
MSTTIDLSNLLARAKGQPAHRVGLFALLSLGITECLASGTLCSDEATRLFFNAQNGLFVKKKLRDKTADEIMSRGVQLQDLFDVLPEREAQKEFQRELEIIRSLCSRLLEQHRLVA